VREWFDELDDDDAYLSVLVVGEIERGIEWENPFETNS
jgi:predicted nucleic acid-binding protein